MITLKKQATTLAILILGMTASGMAGATAHVMDFSHMNANGELVDNYYNGGCGTSYAGGSVSCDGPDYGVVWSSAIAGDAPTGLWNNVANQPSDPNVMGFLDASSAIMNVAGGFDTGFSFYYAAPFNAGSVTVYDGLNGTGNILTTLTLSTNGSNCDGYAQNYSCWSPIGVNFLGNARSVDFGGVANFITFDDVTIGSATPGTPGAPGNDVPEPGVFSMFGLGMLLIGLFTWRRRSLD